MNKELQVNEKINYQAIGEEISHELGAKMVKDYQDRFLNESRSFLIGRTIIEQILAQPGCVGMRFYEALNESGDKTLVYAGMDEKGKTILQVTSVNEHGKIAITPGMIGDRSNSDGTAWLGI